MENKELTRNNIITEKAYEHSYRTCILFPLSLEVITFSINK